MLSQIDIVRRALLTVTNNVYHYHGLKGAYPYVVWAEDSEYDSVEADNRKVNQTIEGTIDLFTKEENDALVDEIQGALCEYCISFRLNTVAYEEETEVIHWEWVWQVGI